jgi:hypothetical protein
MATSDISLAHVRDSLRRVLPPRLYGYLRTAKRSPIRLFQWSLEHAGLVVARTSDYYSPLPSRQHLKHSMNRWSKPSSLHGIDYDLAEMKACLRTLVETYFAEFEEHVPYEVACKRGFGPGYTRLDAIVLYAMIRPHKPAKYLEVGSGVSTYYAAEAAKLNARDGRPMQVTCIDPNPFSLFRVSQAS